MALSKTGSPTDSGPWAELFWGLGLGPWLRACASSVSAPRVALVSGRVRAFGLVLVWFRVSRSAWPVSRAVVARGSRASVLRRRRRCLPPRSAAALLLSSARVVLLGRGCLLVALWSPCCGRPVVACSAFGLWWPCWLVVLAGGPVAARAAGGLRWPGLPRPMLASLARGCQLKGLWLPALQAARCGQFCPGLRWPAWLGVAG